MLLPQLDGVGEAAIEGVMLAVLVGQGDGVPDAQSVAEAHEEAVGEAEPQTLAVPLEHCDSETVAHADSLLLCECVPLALRDSVGERECESVTVALGERLGVTDPLAHVEGDALGDLEGDAVAHSVVLPL